MRRLLLWLLLAALALFALSSGDDPDACPDGRCPAPAPVPPPAPPKKPRWPTDPAAPVGALVAGPRHPDGTEIACDYPGDRHRKNTASKGLGLCVFTSIHHAADWQAADVLLEFPRWLIERGIPGGGHPAKVAELIPRLCKERGAPVPDYLQIESNDLEVLAAACAGGRMPCVTYAFSPTGRYSGRRIAHMVNLVHLDERWAVVLDNNHPGDAQYEWMGHADFLRAYSGGRTGWAVILLDPPPPMPPHDAGAGREASALPKTCPCSDLCVCGCNDGGACPCVGTPADLFGVEPERLGGGPSYRRNGKAVTRAEALDAVARVPDDRQRRRLTVIGPADLRKRVLDDWAAHPALKPFADEYVVRGYAPDHWHVARYGFVTDGRPTIYVQEAGGGVLLRRDRYDGPDDLSAALRRLRPDYSPKNDPRSRLSGLSSKVPWSAWLVGGGAVVAYLMLRRK